MEKSDSVLLWLACSPCRFECSCLQPLYSGCSDRSSTRAAHFAASNSCLCAAVMYARRQLVVSRPPPFASEAHKTARKAVLASLSDSNNNSESLAVSALRRSLVSLRLTSASAGARLSGSSSKFFKDENRNLHYNGNSEEQDDAKKSKSVKSCQAVARCKSTSEQVHSSAIPRFYFPDGLPCSLSVSQELLLLQDAFEKFGGRVQKHEMADLLRVCGVPVFWKQPVWNYMIARQSADTVTSECLLKDSFIPLWQSVLEESHDQASRFVRLLTNGSRDYVVAEDLVTLVLDVADSHEALAWLRSGPNWQHFQLRYVQTVIARLFFAANTSWTGRLTAAELRRCSFLRTLASLHELHDVNCECEYFSYEHFYVIYSKFWELDADHDLVIDHNDLHRYQNFALSSLVTDRIFSATVIRNQLQKQDKMTYQDFVWFLISEVDKRHPRSIEYWFRVMDLDGDGVLSMFELEHFYKEQVKRMHNLGITETLPFSDCVCQVMDMIRPQSANQITLADLKHNWHLCDVFFNTFLNVEKYLENEQRDPFDLPHNFAQDSSAAKRWHAPGANWNRFAEAEYELLVSQLRLSDLHADSVDRNGLIDDLNGKGDFSCKQLKLDRGETGRVQ